MTSITTLADRKKLCRSMEVEYDEAADRGLKRKTRSQRLGVAAVGEECYRKLWFRFRWAKEDKVGTNNHTPGAMRRLWDRGLREEEIFIRWLTASGHRFIQPEGSKQWRITPFAKGHAAGECDGIGQLPEKYGIEDYFLYEFKTLKEASFKEVKKKGVAKAKDTKKYYDQMQMYGGEFGLKFGLFVCVNKNTDEVYFEIIIMSEALHLEARMKMIEIIESQEAPPRESEARGFWKCNICPYQGVCFDGEPVDKNCRSCRFALPAENQLWNCLKWNQLLPEKPEDGICQGCTAHQPIYQIKRT